MTPVVVGLLWTGFVLGVAVILGFVLLLAIEGVIKGGDWLYRKMRKQETAK